MSSLLHALGSAINLSGKVVNYVDLRDDLNLDFLFASQWPLLNKIAITPKNAGPSLPLWTLRQVPTAWAHLCILDLGRFPDASWNQILEDAIRVMAQDGVLLVCATERYLNQLLEVAHSLASLWGDYGSSFGIEKMESASSHIAWYQRNQRYLLGSDYGQATSRGILENQLSMTRQLLQLMRQEHAVLRSRSLEPLIQSSEAWDTCQRLEDELAAKSEEIAALIADADGLKQQLQQKEVCLRDKEVALIHAEEALSRVDVEKSSLQRDLNEITNSFHESQATLHQILESRFWRLSDRPRKLLDRLKCLVRFERREPQAAVGINALPELVELTSANQDQSHDQVSTSQPEDHSVVNHSDHETRCSVESFAEWTGTFLNLADHSIRSAPRRGERCLFVDWRLPEPDKDSGSYRIHQILTIVAGQGRSIDFIGDSETAEPHYIDQLIDLGINVILGRDAGVKHLRKFGTRYHSIVLSRPEIAAFYIPLARCYSPRAKIIYDTVDLHYVRFQRAADLCQDNRNEASRLKSLSRQYQVGELYMSSVVDSVVVVTDVEQRLLSECTKQHRIEVIPNIHSVEASEVIPDFSNREGLLFVGGFDHAPNVDAVLYFCNQIMPLLRQRLPNVKLHIVGSNMPSSILSLKSDDINPVGYVSDLKEYFDSVRLFVAPLRYGAGLKGKVGQSMSYAVPVIGTTIAFEGFDAQHGKHGMIADTPESYADALVEAYQNQELWSALSVNAKQLVEAKFSPKIVASRLRSLVSDVEAKE